MNNRDLEISKREAKNGDLRGFKTKLKKLLFKSKLRRRKKRN